MGSPWARVSLEEVPLEASAATCPPPSPPILDLVRANGCAGANIPSGGIVDAKDSVALLNLTGDVVVGEPTWAEIH